VLSATRSPQQLEGVVQSDCEDIATILNEELIIPLVDWNFGPQDSYPVFAPSARLQIDTATAQLINTLKQSGAVVWDAKDEAWLRDALGMHDIDVTTRQAELDQKKQLLADAAAAANSPNPQRALPPGTPDPNNPATAALRALSRQLSDTGAAPGDTYRTLEYTDWESRILRPDVVSRDLDLAQVRLTSEVQDVLREIDAELRDEAEALAQQGPEAIAAGVRNVAVSNALKRKLRRAMLEAADRMRTYGYDAVHAEIARQVNPDLGIGPTRSPRSGLKRLAADIRDALWPRIRRRQSCSGISLSALKSIAQSKKKSIDASRAYAVLSSP
jgi:hypothetical protein